jgi:predicted naringenin-chalcone synthase
MNPTLYGPSVAVPPASLSASDFIRFARAINPEGSRFAALTAAAVRQSRIEKRHSILADASSNLSFYTSVHPDLPRSTGERMDLYAIHAPRLALAAAQSLLEGCEFEAHSVTHLITVSCTGFQSPGIDSILIESLPLPAEVQRLHLGFMGCHGAMNAIAAARSIAAGDSSALILVVLVELCTLHLQIGESRDEILPNVLFADGAAAFLVSAGSLNLPRLARWELGPTRSHRVPDTAELMTWTIGDHGFRMTLDATVPDRIASVLPNLAQRWGWRDQRPVDWVIHPGGPRILDAAQAALELEASATHASRDVLRHYGNMSSATVLFILRQLRASPARPVRMLAFGPGLTIEAAELRPLGPMP